MSLQLKDLELYQFRNYPSFALHDIGPLTIFVGPNAVGKTNLIEAIQLLTSLTSLKNATANQLISWSEEGAKAEGVFSDQRRTIALSLLISKEKKRYQLNKKDKRPKDIRGLFPSVVFSPDDLLLIKGSQSIKRKALDDLGIQLSSNYQIIKKDYEKLIVQKNHLLKEKFSASFLESINETLVTIGTQFYCYRNSLFQRMMPLVKKYYEIISGKKEIIESSYVPSWENNESENFCTFNYPKEEALCLFSESIQKKLSDEKIRKRSLIGPHADRIEFYIDGKNAGLYGSQGQQRSLVLSIKLAEVELIHEIKNQKPLLLLDDVMSELDKDRRKCLLEFITDDLQTFITTTHLEYFSEDILNRAKIISLSKG